MRKLRGNSQTDDQLALTYINGLRNDPHYHGLIKRLEGKEFEPINNNRSGLAGKINEAINSKEKSHLPADYQDKTPSAVKALGAGNTTTIAPAKV